MYFILFYFFLLHFIFYFFFLSSLPGYHALPAFSNFSSPSSSLLWPPLFRFLRDQTHTFPIYTIKSKSHCQKPLTDDVQIQTKTAPIENRKLQVSTSMRVVAKDSFSRNNILLSMTFEDSLKKDRKERT